MLRATAATGERGSKNDEGSESGGTHGAKRSRLGVARTVQLRVDRPRGLGRHAWNALELGLTRVENPFRGSEVLQQGAAPRRPHSFELIEHRLARGRVAALAVKRHRKAMSFVTNALQQLQPR